MCFFMRWWKSMSLWKDTLFKVMALFGKLQEAWLSQENILAPWQFPLYGSSARNLLCLCSDNLQVLSAFFPSFPAIFAGRESNMLFRRGQRTLRTSAWTKVCRESRFSKLKWKIPAYSVFLSGFTYNFYYNYFSMQFFFTSYLFCAAFCLCKCGIV